MHKMELSTENAHANIDIVCLMVFNATFNIISVLLVEETGEPGENQRPVTSH